MRVLADIHVRDGLGNADDGLVVRARQVELLQRRTSGDEVAIARFVLFLRSRGDAAPAKLLHLVSQCLDAVLVHCAAPPRRIEANDADARVARLRIGEPAQEVPRHVENLTDLVDPIDPQADPGLHPQVLRESEISRHRRRVERYT